MRKVISTHLVIPDSHAKPGVKNTRFEVLGKYIVDVKPDVIINIGDMADMESLCSYDRGKRSFEGRRYKEDCLAVWDAQRKLFKPMQDFNEKATANHRARYKPRLITTLGNHEARIDKVTSEHAELHGTISIQDLKFEKFGWEVIPYMQPINVDGINYCHFFTTGVMSKAISGTHQAYSLLQKQYVSCTMGHTHTLDYKVLTDGVGKKLQGLVVGCYMEPDQREDYAGPANELWWKGVILKHVYDDGSYDPEFISIDRLYSHYLGE